MGMNSMADLSVNYAGLALKNPLICASGPITDTVEGCEAAANAGFAAVVLKSIMHRGAGPLRYKHAVPRFQIVDALRPYERWRPRLGIDRMGLCAWGEAGSVWTEEKYCCFVNEVKRTVGECVKVGASVVGSVRNPESWDEYIEMFENSDADFVEMDMGYPRFYGEIEKIPKIIAKAKNRLSKPLTVKMAPFLTDPVGTARMFQNAGVDGLAMFDSTYGLDFNIDGMKLPFWNTWSPLPPGVLLSYTNARIAEARMGGIATSISASFGPWHWEDAIKCIMSGSDAVQICRRVILRGCQEATTWLEKMDSWLDRNGHKSVQELKGKILDKIVMDYAGEIPREEPLERGGIPSAKAVLDREKCAGCTDFCTRVCLYSALTAADRQVSIDERKCAGCGMCEGVCSFRALSLQSRDIDKEEI